jgi:transposase
MSSKKEIIRLFNEGHSIRKIADSSNVAVSTVSFYVNLFKSSGLDYDSFMLLTDEEIKAGNDKKAMPDMNELHLELKRKGVTLYLLWKEYIEKDPSGYRYSQFAYYYNLWKKSINPVMRFNHKMGEKVFVDFSGYRPSIKNQLTGETTEVELFVAVLGASNYNFAYAVYSQSLENWIDCHIKMFKFFGGVTVYVVPDNLKAGVTSPCYYDPVINKSYFELSLHYDTVILPARPNKPKDKPKVENGVLNAQRSILAPLRDKIFFSIEELNLAISKALKDYNETPMQKIKRTRKELFEEEKRYLKPLPESFKFSNWKRACVGIDYHVDVEGTYYCQHRI